MAVSTPQARLCGEGGAVKTLQFRLLGPLEISCGDRPLSKPPTLKSQSLLAYLVLHRDRPQPRERLAEMFWGDRPERKARRSLATALWHIRRCLPDETLLLSDSYTAQFDPHTNIWLDVEAFESQATRDDMSSLRSAVECYRGEFLAGFYDDWIISERYRIEALFFEALARLMVGHEARGDQQAALAAALRLLSRDPLRENAHRMAMRSYTRLGQRSAALEQYERCRDVVLQELGTEPMVETSELYQEILEGRFRVGPLAHRLPVERPAVGPAGRSPLDVVAPVRLVGREQELALLDECWREAQAGQGGLVLISGEAGVGKTRLVEAFADRLRWRGVRVLWGRSYEFERALPYQPVAEALRTALPALTSDQLETVPPWAMAEVGRLVPEVLEHPLLGEDPGERDRQAGGPSEVEAWAAGDLDQEQARLFAGMTRLLAELCARRGCLLVLEDLHWASESTLQLLHYLACHLADQPAMIVGTFRPEALGLQHPLRALRRRLAREGLARPLRLSRLSREAVGTMVVEMSGAGRVVLPLAGRLYQETEGNPFFLMEIVKALFETGLIRLEEGSWQGDFARISEGELPLPASVSEAVQARVQRLNEKAQQAVRLVAVLGRAFDFEVLNAVWDRGEEVTLEALDDLLRQRLIDESTDEAGADYAFTHHKIQEVVYEELPRRRRQYLHGQVGAAMEALLGDDLGARAGELAHHYEQACLIDKSLSGRAVMFLRQAGQRAVRGSAHQEAIAYYRRGLDILRSLPETVERVRQEIELQLALAGPTTVVHGYGAPESRRVYDRARDLCQSLGEAPELFTALAGLTRHYGVSGDVETGLALAEQLLAIAQKSGDRRWLLEACRQMGGLVLDLGRLQQARSFLERGVALYDPAEHEYHAYRFGHDPVVTCLSYLSLTLWLLGYPEQTERQSQALKSLMQSMTHPSSLAYAHAHLALLACARRDPQAARDHAEAALRVGELHGLPMWSAMATALRGWALTQRGQAVEGLAQLEEGTRLFQAQGFRHFTAFFLGLQAQWHLERRRFKEAAAALSAARATVESQIDRYWEAEIERLHRELVRVRGGDAASAEACFRQAMATAHQQDAQMLELRAAVSLAQLWQSQGKRQAAREMLAEVYGWFEEGLETHDLEAARAVLRSLS
jgi:DNA-binding SARP family transcriptional activator/predicted ATPase